ncbi:prolyl hydroxylase family protein [Congregibacter sp.]|uniref:prolyl hydroxylase family protein n=1 Tax=Congregibacter sp. TaxID=2744308 RepID=UPI003F6D2472
MPDHHLILGPTNYRQQAQGGSEESAPIIELTHKWGLHRLASKRYEIATTALFFKGFSMAISDEWVAWARSNLRGGSTIEDTRSALEAQGFAARDVKYALKKAASKKSYQREVRTKNPKQGRNTRQTDVDYAALAAPRVVRETGNGQITALCIDELQLFAIRNFLSTQKCKILIDAITANAHPSKVDGYEQQSDIRSSRTCSLRAHEFSFIADINQRIASTLGLNNGWAEVTQGQWYEPGQQYKTHPDYFVPGTKEYERFAAAEGQRTWTFMIYLNKPELGGGTHFSKISKTIMPEQGLAICWNNLLANGEPNPNTLHAGLPVEAGSKFIITKWFRDRGTGLPFVSE